MPTQANHLMPLWSFTSSFSFWTPASCFQILAFQWSCSNSGENIAQVLPPCHKSTEMLYGIHGASPHWFAIVLQFFWGGSSIEVRRLSGFQIQLMLFARQEYGWLPHLPAVLTANPAGDGCLELAQFSYWKTPVYNGGTQLLPRQDLDETVLL